MSPAQCKPLAVQVLERRRQDAIQAGRMIDLSNEGEGGLFSSGGQERQPQTAGPKPTYEDAVAVIRRDDQEEEAKELARMLAPIVERQVSTSFLAPFLGSMRARSEPADVDSWHCMCAQTTLGLGARASACLLLQMI